uniref:Uncharacterized protein n=1 Tax=Lates calcarifer TaxID=8187 RepID=A0A4W6FIF1_LATCA
LEAIRMVFSVSIFRLFVFLSSCDSLRLRRLLQLPSKGPLRLGWSCCERQSTALLPFNRGTYRCQTHHTPCNGCLAFFPLYMVKVWSEI